MSDELKALDPESQILTLKSGIPIKIEEMRLRQTTRLMRIVTRPVAQGLVDLNDLDISADADKEAFGARLVVILLTVIPESEDEFVDFLRSMVSPGNLIEKPVLQKSDVETNKRLWAALDKELINPSKADTKMLIKEIISREASELRDLGKELTEDFRRATKKPESPNTTVSDISTLEESPDPFTPSNAHMDGQMINAMT